MLGAVREHYERELAVTVSTGTERWLTELRLAVVGIILSVALGAADIALSVSTWQVALVAGVGSTLVFTGLLWRLRPRERARRTDLDGELRELGRGIAELRAAVDAEPNPLRELLEAWAAAMEELAEHADRIAEEAYLTTDPGSALRRLRDYDRDLSELTAEIRCRRARA
jgi:ABC-type nitrate/sulfonate/bicarbonate transport system substrate-binding protein